MAKSSSTSAEPAHKPPRQKRPLSLTALVLLTLLGAALVALRAIDLGANLTTYRAFAPTTPWAYLTVGASIWAALGLLAAIGLWLRRRWAWWLHLLGLPMYHIHTWIDRMWFEASPYARHIWPWLAAFTLTTLVFNTVLLLRPSLRQHFLRPSTRRPQTEP